MSGENDKGFEYVPRGPENKTPEATQNDAKYVLNTMKADYADGLSADAFIWGMEGCGVTEEAAKNILQQLAAASIVSFSKNGHIQYSPQEVPESGSESA